jgi:hypothetical protein
VDCQTQTCFNIPAVAGLYSQLAGTVAGLSFAALVYILTVNYDKPPTPERRDNLERVATAFFMAMASLAVCSLIFASLAGHETSGGRAASVQLFGSIAFIFAAMELLFGVVCCSISQN